MSLTFRTLSLAHGMNTSSLQEFTARSPDPSNVRTTEKEQAIATRESCFLSSKEGTEDNYL